MKTFFDNEQVDEFQDGVEPGAVVATQPPFQLIKRIGRRSLRIKARDVPSCSSFFCARARKSGFLVLERQ